MDPVEGADPSRGEDPRDRWLSTADAAALLGVKPATLYAYVSRGLIDSHPAPDRRGSVFHRDDVDRLTGRRRLRDGDVVVHSRITDIRDNRLYYRGHDVTHLAGRRQFEDVAELLWTGRLPGDRQRGKGGRPSDPRQLPGSSKATGRWEPSALAVAAAVGAQQGVPASSSPLDRLRLATVAASTTDPLRGDLRPQAVRRVGRQLIATLVEALPPATDGVEDPPTAAVPAPTIAGRLWPKLTERPPEPALVAVLDTAMVLLADHELAASTLAARVAASTHCDPYAVVECGLAALGGSLHGAAAVAVEQLLEGGDVTASLQRASRHLREHGRLPGFGHFAYPDGDPRARSLLATLRNTAATAGRMAGAEAVMAAAADRGLPAPTIDFALAALTMAVGMPVGAAEAVFGLARCAGWLAHALEQYETGELIRPRAVYIGPSA